MNYDVTEVHGKPTLTFKDSIILVIIGIFIFMSAGVSDVFKMSAEWSRKYEAVEVAELVILSLILAFAFGIFSLWRRRDIKHEMANPKQAEEKVKNTNRRLPEDMKEGEEFPWIFPHDLDAPVWNISDMAASIIRKYGDSMDADVKDRLTRIQKNGERELGLIRNPLELFRIKTEMEQFEEVDPDELVQRVDDGFSHELEGKGVRLSAVKAIVEAFGGEVWVGSPSKDSRRGKGAKGVPKDRGNVK